MNDSDRGGRRSGGETPKVPDGGTDFGLILL